MTPDGEEQNNSLIDSDQNKLTLPSERHLMSVVLVPFCGLGGQSMDAGRRSPLQSHGIGPLGGAHDLMWWSHIWSGGGPRQPLDIVSYPGLFICT